MNSVNEDVSNLLSIIYNSDFFQKYSNDKHEYMLLNFIHKFDHDPSSTDFEDLFHIFFYLEKIIRDKDDNCLLCNSPNHYKKYLPEFLLTKKDVFIILLNSFYEVPLTLAQNVVIKLKCVMSTESGMFAADVSTLMLDELKKIKSINVTYHGVYFPFLKVSRRLDKPTCVEVLAQQIIKFRDVEKKSASLLIVGAGPDTLTPEHWCAIFIDHVNYVYYYYNSLAKPKQVDKKLFNLLNEYTKIDNFRKEYMFVANVYPQQNKNTLCGIYSIHFLITMAKEAPSSRMKLFKTMYNINCDMDKEYEDIIQRKYIIPALDEDIPTYTSLLKLKRYI